MGRNFLLYKGCIKEQLSLERLYAKKLYKGRMMKLFDTNAIYIRII